jgi:hypothetical protein
MGETTEKLVEVLSRVSTESTHYMTVEERSYGIAVMLGDLNRLAREDGCIAAAWALEMIDKLASEHLGATNG